MVPLERVCGFPSSFFRGGGIGGPPFELKGDPNGNPVSVGAGGTFYLAGLCWLPLLEEFPG